MPKVEATVTTSGNVQILSLGHNSLELVSDGGGKWICSSDNFVIAGVKRVYCLVTGINGSVYKLVLKIDGSELSHPSFMGIIAGGKGKIDVTFNTDNTIE